ncbi:hypothetical protein ACR6C2_02640 [Streptomyces sp. INA 01156]
MSAVGVFFMRQYLSEALPDELVEAGRVDGRTRCGSSGVSCCPSHGPPWPSCS